MPDVNQLRRFDEWAKQLPNIEISAVLWNARIASVLSACGHNKEALAKCLEVDLSGPNVWPALLQAAEVTFALDQHQDALDYLHRIKSEYSHLLDEDVELRKAYWSTVLRQEGQIHWALKDLDSAQECFLEVVNNKTNKDAIAGHKGAMADLFQLWDERKAYDLALDRVRSWMSSADRSDNAVHWFMLLHAQTDFHTCLVSTALNAEGSRDIVEAYEHVISSADPQSNRQKIRVLKCYFAAVLYHSSPSPDAKSIAYGNWEDVVSTSGADSDSWWPAPEALKYMLPRLLDDARSSGLAPMTAVASQHAETLENISMADLSVIRDAYTYNNDSRLVLIRLHTLAAQHDKAKALATECLRGIFDDWPASSNASRLFNRYSRLGQVLNVLDDDKNAAAGWCLLQPQRPEPSVLVEETVPGAENNSQDNEVPGEAMEDPPQAVDDTDSPPGDQGSTDDQKAEEGAGPEVAESQDLFAGLTSKVSHWCDGCSTAFRALADVYVCKDCLNMHLCPSCYRKLKGGELHVLCCNKEQHAHMYLPPFNRKQWEEMNAEQMLVGDAVVSRSAWLDELREQWGLGQDRIDKHKAQMAAQIRAAKVLTRWRRTILKVRAATMRSLDLNSTVLELNGSSER